MDVKLTWNQDMAFTGTADSGHEVTLDSSEGSGGHNTGFRPMELMALGTAGCSSMDVVSILRKKRVPFTAYECKVHVESVRDAHPHVFELMEFEYILTGKGIDRTDVERAVQLSEEKYCQGIAMMRKTAEIRSKITIIEE
jgi:putative redox protein